MSRDGSAPRYLYFLDDHLVPRPGSGVIDSPVIDGGQEKGDVIGSMEAASFTTDQPYRFIGNELYADNGLGLYDFKARLYDPATGRFLSVDPLAEKYYSVSPYAYCAGNPVMYVDPDGRNPLLGAIVGGLSSYAGQVVVNLALRGQTHMTMKEVFLTNIDFTDVGVSTVEGALTSGASAVRKVLIGTVSGAIQSAVNVTYANGIVTNDVDDVVVGALTGAVMSTLPDVDYDKKPFSITNNSSLIL